MAHAQALILATFALTTALAAAFETGPFGARVKARHRAWWTAACLVVVSSAIRLSVIGAAGSSRQEEWSWASVALLVLGLDFFVWVRHWCFHRVPLLWRFHGVHHTDVELDPSTALRFHPFEILMDSVCDAAVIRLLGVPTLPVVIYALAVSFVGVVSHSRIPLPESLDRFLGWVWVTPRLHRAHHSLDAARSFGNYGVIFTFWDTIFGTRQPRAAFSDPVGVVGFDDKNQPLTAALLGLALSRALEENRGTGGEKRQRTPR